LKSQFVSTVSHEFRTPLGIILSSIDLLQHHGEKLEPVEREENLTDIRTSVTRMSGLMEQVLLMGKAESGQIVVRCQSFDLEALTRQVAEEIGSAQNARGVVRVNAQLNGSPEAHGDERLVRLILSNLISNAVKYSDRKTPVHVSIEAVLQDAVIRVRDEGIGISVADQSRLFEDYRRGANVLHLPGTGLGLSIVRRCVELHGGRIHCESSEGRGSTFTVIVPLFAPVRP
jgi:signal transduction histidine kinase